MSLKSGMVRRLNNLGWQDKLKWNSRGCFLFYLVCCFFVSRSLLPEYVRGDNCASCYYFVSMGLIILCHLENSRLVAESSKNMLRDVSLFWLIDAGICRNSTVDWLIDSVQLIHNDLSDIAVNYFWDWCRSLNSTLTILLSVILFKARQEQ